MDYITAKEAAEKWGVTERMVRVYCSQGRIPDASLLTKELIPSQTN